MTSQDPATHQDVQFCLDGIGVARPGWRTLVVTATADSPATPQDVWTLWSNLADWPSWSPLHQATEWTGPPGFIAGATFDQTLSLGFPAGTATDHVTVAIAEPARRASWSGDANGVRSCHLWTFAALANGGTRIGNTEVFDGTVIGLTKPMLAARWRRQFQQAAEALAQLAVPARR
ncbi:MAG: SRPBCC family protein [Hamadaea sp.]|uniref:SRPBCC family protein n=1 Tax=Hamadaea sp. TaxID=2024425 RepID=UPI00185B7C9F|nr:SRPBCC family protein [Hamadaea sp.]NUT21849.1 SRPBCC family protein [Hamadaea sp.]